MAKCNICNRRWWFSSQVKCDCKSSHSPRYIEIGQIVLQNVHLLDLQDHVHTGHSTNVHTTSPCAPTTPHFSEPRQESSSCDSSNSSDSGSPSSSGWD